MKMRMRTMKTWTIMVMKMRRKRMIFITMKLIKLGRMGKRLK